MWCCQSIKRSFCVRRRVVARREERLVVHPDAVRGVRGARARDARGGAVHARGQAAGRALPHPDLLRGPLGLQLPPLPAPRPLRVTLRLPVHDRQVLAPCTEQGRPLILARALIRVSVSEICLRCALCRAVPRVHRVSFSERPKGRRTLYRQNCSKTASPRIWALKVRYMKGEPQHVALLFYHFLSLF